MRMTLPSVNLRQTWDARRYDDRAQQSREVFQSRQVFAGVAHRGLRCPETHEQRASLATHFRKTSHGFRMVPRRVSPLFLLVDRCKNTLDIGQPSGILPEQI